MYSPNEKSGFDLKDFIIIIIIGLVIYNLFIKEEIIHYGPGAMAPMTPIQTDIDNQTPIMFKDYAIKKLAAYDITAKVLSRKKYDSELSPIDFALGWGNMSDEDILKRLEFSQHGRWYYFKWEEDPPPLSIKEMSDSSANTHIIPANEDIKKKIMDVKTGSIIHLKGYLVLVTGKNGFRWKSSLTRKDTGNGGCEVFYVDEVISN